MITYKSKGQGKTVSKGANGSEKESLHTTPAVDTDGTTVGFHVGHTMNLGNYESAKFEVWLTLPTTVDKVDAAFVQCQEWADAKLTAVIEEAKGEVA